MWAGVAVGGGVRHLPTVLYATVLREVVTSTLGGGGKQRLGDGWGSPPQPHFVPYFQL